jgi:hypothetical protein
MKIIRKGDKVTAYLDARITGIVVDVIEEPARVWSHEGTMNVVRICVIRLPDGRVMRVNSSELFIEY